MPRANEIKKGMVLNYNGKLLIVKDIDIQAPSARGAATLYKMRFSDVRTGLKVEERFKGDDIVDTVTLTRRYVDFSYIDGNEYVFMDKEDYTPYIFTKDQIEEELLFIPEGGMPDMQVLTWDGVLLALELPQTVDLEIVETAPGIKGASASARNKPATLTTGLVVQVPEYLWVVLTDPAFRPVALRFPGLQKTGSDAGFCVFVGRVRRSRHPATNFTAVQDTSSFSAPARYRALPPSLSDGQSPNTLDSFSCADRPASGARDPDGTG